MRRTRRMTRVAARVMAAGMLAGMMLACMGLAGMPPCAGSARAEQAYVSIREIRESLPERWTGDYTIQKGDKKHVKDGGTVHIDAPIIVPEVEAVPVVRITWEPPMEALDGSLKIERNFRGIKYAVRDYSSEELDFSLAEDGTTFDPGFPWEDVRAAAIECLHTWYPFMRDKELECFYQQAFGTTAQNGSYAVSFYNCYYGIPHLIGDNIFRYGVESEREPYSKNDEGATVPSGLVRVLLKNPVQFVFHIYTSQEVGIEIEDIPLLPFESILKLLEKRVEDGYVYSLKELRFGYMTYIDPEHKGSEFVLLPVWTAKGRTRGELVYPFDLMSDQSGQSGYFTTGALVINAQTGELFDFYNDKRPDRRYVPHIITWEEVGM